MIENILWQQTCRETVSAPPLSGGISADLVVIGGGYTGCSAALHGALGGADVCLIEAQTIGHGGSGRNVGLVNAGLWSPPDDIRAQMGAQTGDRLSTLLAEAPALVFSLIDRFAINCEPARAGTLHCAHSRAGLADLHNRHAQLTAMGAPVTVLASGETARRTGSGAFHGALFDPTAGTLHPLGYARGLARAATGAGARLYEETPAQTVGYADGQWRVETPDGTVTAGALLLATNGYHSKVSGLDAPQFVPVHYMQVATVPLGAEQRAGILPGGEGCWDTAMVMSSFRMDRAGRMIVGGMGDLDAAGASVHAGWARRKIAQMFPALKGVEMESATCGRIAMTTDHIPRILDIGPDALAGFGYSGRGIGPGTLFGKQLAHALLRGDPNDLPVPVVAAHREPLAGVRARYYEAGATLTHLLQARV